MGVSCCVAVAAVGGALLVGVLVGVVGEVGAVGLVLLLLYMGGLCLNWPGRVAPGAAESSACRLGCRPSRPDPPAFAEEEVTEGRMMRQGEH